MPNNYTFFDSDGSILTARSSIVSGSAHDPYVQISSFLTAVPTTPSGNQSVSGTINIGNAPSVYGNISGSVASYNQAGTAVLGSVATLQGTNPWIMTGSVQGFPTNQNVSGSVIAFQGGSWTPSVSGTVGASIIGLSPVRISDGTDLLDIYEENQIDTSVVGLALMFRSNANTSLISVVSPTTPLPASVQGNVGITNTNLNVGGSVISFQGGAWTTSVVGNIGQTGTIITSLVSTIPSSVLVGTSIFGQLPAGTAVLGSVATLQGTSPWNIAGSVLAVQGTWSGSVLATISGTPNVNTAGSVLSQQLGTRTTSVVGSIPSSLLAGVYAHRNDATASFLGGNLTWNPIATDSAGRIIIKPFTSDDGTLIEYQGSVVSTSVTVIRASAIGLRNYITDFFMANTGATTTLITFQDGSTSILGRTIAPTASGSNAPGIAVPMRSARSQDLAFVAGSNTSVLYVTVRGYQAP